MCAFGDPAMRLHPWIALLCGTLLATIAASANGAPESPDSRPLYGTYGFDAAGGDPNTKPGDDFFRYANGHWLDTTDIPADKPAYSLRLMMTDRVEQRLHDMME